MSPVSKGIAIISSTFTAVEIASLVAAVLIAGVAAFQVALALGLPLGGAVFGGKRLVEVTLSGLSQHP